MKTTLPLPLCLFLLAIHLHAQDATPAKSAAPATGKLVIDASSTEVPRAKVSLIVGVLSRQKDLYVGDYRLKVSPYFFKNETGKLSIVLSEESLHSLMEGTVVNFTGHSVTDGNGRTRVITGTATPAGRDHGAVTFSIPTDETKLIFNTDYHFEEK